MPFEVAGAEGALHVEQHADVGQVVGDHVAAVGNDQRPGAAERGARFDVDVVVLQPQVAVERRRAARLERQEGVVLDLDRRSAPGADRDRAAEVGASWSTRTCRRVRLERRARIEVECEAVGEDAVRIRRRARTVPAKPNAGRRRGVRALCRLMADQDARVGRAVPVVVVAGGFNDERAAVAGDELRVVDDARR